MLIENSSVMVNGRVESRPEPTAVRADGIRVAWSLCMGACGETGGDVPRWVRVVAAGPLAERVLCSVTAGDAVRIRGSLRTRNWTDSRGNRRSVEEVQVDELEADPRGPNPRDASGPQPDSMVVERGRVRVAGEGAQ